MNKKTKLLLFYFFWCSIPVMGIADPLSDAFQQGQQAAGGGAAAGNAINNTGANTNIPGYTTSPKEAQHWGDGKVSLTGIGTGKQMGCTTADTGGFSGKECDAINFLGGSRPHTPLNRDDALFNLSDGITKDNRDAITGLNGGSGTGGCTTVEVKNPDLESTEHCEEFLEPVDKRCPVGQVVVVDKDANYQCEVTTAQTVQYECHKKIKVTVTKGVTGSTGKIVLATIRTGMYLFKNGTNDGLWLHDMNGQEYPVGAVSVFDGNAVGLTYDLDYGGYKRLLISHNGCSGVCSGAFSYEVLRGNGTWWNVTGGSFSQQSQDTLVCPKQFTVGEAWVGGGGYLNATASCTEGASGAITLSAMRVTPWCGSMSGTYTLLPGQSANLGVGTCPATITYYGSGSFTYSYWSHHDSSSDAHSWKATGFSLPTQKDSITYEEVNECATLESRSRD